jgi:hypothetical protein
MGQLAAEDEDSARFAKEVWSTGQEPGAAGVSGGCCFEWSTGQRVDVDDDAPGCWVEDKVWPISRDAREYANKQADATSESELRCRTKENGHVKAATPCR